MAMETAFSAVAAAASDQEKRTDGSAVEIVVVDHTLEKEEESMKTQSGYQPCYRDHAAAAVGIGRVVGVVAPGAVVEVRDARILEKEELPYMHALLRQARAGRHQIDVLHAVHAELVDVGRMERLPIASFVLEAQVVQLVKHLSL